MGFHPIGNQSGAPKPPAEISLARHLKALSFRKAMIQSPAIRAGSGSHVTRKDSWGPPYIAQSPAPGTFDYTALKWTDKAVQQGVNKGKLMKEAYIPTERVADFVQGLLSLLFCLLALLYQHKQCAVGLQEKVKEPIPLFLLQVPNEQGLALISSAPRPTRLSTRKRCTVGT